MIVSIVVLSYTGYKINKVRTQAFNVYLGEDKIGVVRSEEDVSNLVDNLQKELSNTYNMEIVLKTDIEFEK